MVPEFGTGGPGVAIHDTEVDTTRGAYARPGCAYFVVEHDGTVLGRGGLAPLEHGDAATRELRKTCFLATLRGLGAGRALFARCLDAARQLDFARRHLETLADMDAAQALYAASRFLRIDHALGDTGHHACNRLFLREP